MVIKNMSRRQFIRDMVVAGAVAPAVVSAAGGRSRDDSAFKICIFSKHLQWLDYEGMAEAAAELGFDGVDLTVRNKGHVLPERIEDDLPKAVEAIKRAGIDPLMMATDINDPDDPHTEKILKTPVLLASGIIAWASTDTRTTRALPRLSARPSR